MQLNEQTQQGVDKVARYGWTVTDKPGVMMEINKRELVVDADYQRHVAGKDGKVLRIAAEWSWVACGAIIVGMRYGTAYVIDGQHRVLAAMKRSDITKLPCIVFETLDKKEEAGAFLRANRNRKPMTTIQAFNALVTSGDQHAVKAATLIEATGRAMERKSSPTTFSAPGAVMQCIKENEGAINRVWPLIIDACDGYRITNEIILGLFYIESRLDGRESLSTQPWRGKVLRLGASGLTHAIDRARAFYTKGGARIYAAGIVEAINKGAKTNRLEME